MADAASNPHEAFMVQLVQQMHEANQQRMKTIEDGMSEMRASVQQTAVTIARMEGQLAQAIASGARVDGIQSAVDKVKGMGIVIAAVLGGLDGLLALVGWLHRQ